MYIANYSESRARRSSHKYSWSRGKEYSFYAVSQSCYSCINSNSYSRCYQDAEINYFYEQEKKSLKLTEEYRFSGLII